VKRLRKGEGEIGGVSKTGKEEGPEKITIGFVNGERYAGFCEIVKRDEMRR